MVWLRRLNWPTLLLHLGVCLQGRNTLQVHSTELSGFSLESSEPQFSTSVFWRNVLYVSIDGKPDLANVIQGRGFWIFTGVLAIDEHEPTYGCWWQRTKHSIMLNVKCCMPQKTQTESIFRHPVETIIMLHSFILIQYLGASWSWIVDVTIFLGSHSCRFLPAWCRNFAVFGIQTATVDSRECL